MTGLTEYNTDIFRFEVSDDGGSTWDRVMSFSGDAGSSFSDQRPSVFDLSAYDGSPSVRIRLRFESNGSITYDGRYFDDVEVIAKALPPDTAAPTVPTDLISTAAAATSVSLAWGASTDDRGVAAYDVYRIDPSGPVKVGETTATTFTVGGLTPSTPYTFHVVARDAAGNVSPPSNAVTRSTAALAVPVAPTNLTATKLSKSRVRLNWTDRSNNETGFRVWSSRDGVTWTLLATAAADATSFTTGTLGRGTWHFRVSAFNADGESPFSNTVTINL